VTQAIQRLSKIVQLPGHEAPLLIIQGGEHLLNFGHGLISPFERPFSIRPVTGSLLDFSQGCEAQSDIEFGMNKALKLLIRFGS